MAAAVPKAPPGPKADPNPAKPPTCPAGTELVAGKGCVPKIETSCPAGLHFEEGKGCVANVVGCPDGMTMKEGKCAPAIASCPEGTTMKDGKCQPPTAECPAGMFLKDGVCAKSTLPTEGCVGEGCAGHLDANPTAVAEPAKATAGVTATLQLKIFCADALLPSSALVVTVDDNPIQGLRDARAFDDKTREREVVYVTAQIPAGTHVLKVTGPGCAEYASELQFAAGDTVKVDGVLDRSAGSKLTHLHGFALWGGGLLGIVAADREAQPGVDRSAPKIVSNGGLAKGAFLSVGYLKKYFSIELTAAVFRVSGRSVSTGQETNLGSLRLGPQFGFRIPIADVLGLGFGFGVLYSVGHDTVEFIPIWTRVDRYLGCNFFVLLNAGYTVALRNRASGVSMPELNLGFGYRGGSCPVEPKLVRSTG